MSDMTNLGDMIFKDIENNVFLNELYDNILYNYAINKLHLADKRQMRDIDLLAALRFTDLLSKSIHLHNSDNHKMWAQEIIVLLNELYPDNETVKMYAGSVFSSTGNHQGMNIINTNYKDFTALEKIFSQFRHDYLTIPAAPNMRFFNAQKEAYDHLSDACFSYSGPTSMGKSFIMRMFIKDQIMHGVDKNFVLVVPSKALINEVRAKTIQDLKDLLAEHNYCVVTAAGDLALESEHNFILVLTPERLLYFLISKPELRIDYLFIDEAHKLSGKNSRGPFYYKVVDMLLKRPQQPHFIFAAPNIPNPEVYLKLLADIDVEKDNKFVSTFSPVAQIKFLIDFDNHGISIYNERTNEPSHIATIKDQGATLTDILVMFEILNQKRPIEKRQQSIVYYNGRSKAIEAACAFAKRISETGDSDLIALSKDIQNEVHGDYYLTEIIKKGVAYHIGYLPASIRMRIEELFQAGKISTMFCTSTLLEGVNLPADNLFITDYKIFRSKMTAIDFRNLIGRVGRISFNLYGNVFFVSSGDKVQTKDYLDLLQEKIPEQTLSIESSKKTLTNSEKKHIVATLLSGSIELDKRTDTQSEESYVMMRKFALILLRDIMENRNSLVRREFASILTTEDAEKIKASFTDPIAMPDDDINVSVDQTKKLRAAIAFDVHYPERVEGEFVYDDVLAFLEKLSKIFNWKKYEYSSLGRVDASGQLALLRWYTVILIQWMEGIGLGSIMKKAIKYRQDHPNDFWINKYQKATYLDTVEHRNIVFADTLEVIENVILFSISNYFLRFSNEYKRVHNVIDFDNNWYEFVEYGTTNPITILLQRNGFSREASTYIKNHKIDYIVEDEDGNIKLNRSLLECSNVNVQKEAADIQYNVPGIFVDK